MQWCADEEIQADETVHVWPLEETEEHALEGVDCWCRPALELKDKATLVIHNRKQ